jgi:hypothetical protein
MQWWTSSFAVIILHNMVVASSATTWAWAKLVPACRGTPHRHKLSEALISFTGERSALLPNLWVCCSYTMGALAGGALLWWPQILAPLAVCTVLWCCSLINASSEST